jgi:hypothetical protein
LIGLPSLIAGIILLTAGAHWFAGAATVGLILTVASGVLIALRLLFALIAILAASNR